jgi:general secretion pathway protein K
VSAHRSKAPWRQRGIALITAVLVVSLAVIAATSVLDSGHFAIQRAATLQDSEKAWGYATGAEDWVRTILQRDAKDNRHDALDEVWAEPQTLPVENGAITGVVIDATSRFNLNNLGVSDDQVPIGSGAEKTTAFQQQVRLFARLIENVEGGPERIPNPQQLAEAIRDWIDADQMPTGGGREDSDYLILEPQRRAANRPMASVTELRTVLDSLYDPRTDDARKVYQLLLPYVTALPVQGVTPINVNTAEPPLLMALSPGNAKLAQFSELRKEKPLKQTSELTTELELKPMEADPTLVSVSTALFQLRLQAVVGQGRVALYSLIFRPSQGMPVVLQRSTDSE